jgi:uncharacterized protein YqgV (UPF0045/DUF77 family)
MLSAEVSIYPLKTNNATQVIDGAIQALTQEQVQYKVGSISTHINGMMNRSGPVLKGV